MSSRIARSLVLCAVVGLLGMSGSTEATSHQVALAVPRQLAEVLDGEGDSRLGQVEAVARVNANGRVKGGMRIKRRGAEYEYVFRHTDELVVEGGKVLRLVLLGDGTRSVPGITKVEAFTFKLTISPSSEPDCLIFDLVGSSFYGPDAPAQVEVEGKLEVR